MFTFLLAFTRRGFTSTFSYHSWQVTARMFQSLTDVTTLLIFTFLLISLFI